MKKYKYSKTNQEFYCGVLANGMRVCVIPIPEKKSYYTVLGVNFGSSNVSFIPNGEKDFINVPYGIAHFLEHKMFEMQDGEDPFSFFSKRGANANASTSFDSTKYYVWGVENPYENLDYLLKYVCSPYFTKENIQKEQGIIGEEIKMYDDDPAWAIDDISRKMAFNILPIREKISGTVEDIAKITKEDLYNCYNTFYTPNNMTLVIGGDVSPNEVIKVLKNNEYLKKMVNNNHLVRKEYEENDTVLTEFREVKMNVIIPKVKYLFKLNRDNFTLKDYMKLDMYLSIISSVLFGSTSIFYEKVREEQIATDYYIDHNYYGKFYTLEFDAESDKADLFKDEIDNSLKNIVITEADLERIKRVWIASEIKITDSIDMIVENTFDDYLYYGGICPDRFLTIQSLNIEELREVIKELNFDNSCFMLINPKDKTSL